MFFWKPLAFAFNSSNENPTALFVEIKPACTCATAFSWIRESSIDSVIRFFNAEAPKPTPKSPIVDLKTPPILPKALE